MNIIRHTQTHLKGLKGTIIIKTGIVTIQYTTRSFMPTCIGSKLLYVRKTAAKKNAIKERAYIVNHFCDRTSSFPQL